MNPTMYKCSRCGRIKRFSDWIYFSDTRGEEREKLNWLLVTNAIEWIFIHCPPCADFYKK
jgi:uncharacterized C2H2 Zn-finger protein